MTSPKLGVMLAILYPLLATQLVLAVKFNISRSDNVALYYGQNSYGATNSDDSTWQKSLATYCQDDAVNIIPLAFVNNFFSTGGLPEINLSNTCSWGDGVFNGTNLANCQFMAEDIRTCQSKGKIITLSFGGSKTGPTNFTSDAQAKAFAKTIWNLFLGGSSSTRPFGQAVLDGIDLDLEGGSNQHMATFVKTIRQFSKKGKKRYYITGAPQCNFPDEFYGPIINTVPFDALYVQFYNNWCGLQNFNNSNAWNFGVWDDWAKTTSPNKNIKIYLGAPASSTASATGYLNISSLADVIHQTRAQYSSFGGVMLWDASQAYANNRYDAAVKKILTCADA